MRIRPILNPLYNRPETRGALKALVPVRYHARLRAWFASETNVHWCRVVMNGKIEQFIRSLDCKRLDVLEISGTGSQGRYDFRSYRSVQYPSYDVCEAPLPEEFDLIIAEQVFEHVLRPDRAAANVHRMLRPGGVFVITTPFLLKVHGAPDDLYRWTETGMRLLLETAGFEVMSTGSWGNRDCLMADMTPDLNWTMYRPGLHSLRNEPQFPLVVWTFARRKRLEEQCQAITTQATTTT
jgi:SAM-dependent methyltransferase